MTFRDFGLSEERVPPGFARRANEIRAVARLLNGYLRETDVDVEGSPAAVEYAQEPSFADEHVPDPVLHVLLRGQQGMVAATDHLLGLAACVEADDVVLASISLLRPIVVAVGMAYYLLDPGISLRERLRRGWNFELDSVREQLNAMERQSAGELWDRTVETRLRYLAWAAANGFGEAKKSDRFGEPRFWLTDAESVEPLPSEIKLAEAVLESVGDGALGRTVYRFTSSFLHTRAHALTLFQPARAQYDPETPGTVPLGVSLADLTTWLMVVVMAVHTASSRTGSYFGWDLGRWVATVRPVLDGWADELRPESGLWLPGLEL
ncbi:MAG: hypothetical protein ACYCWW_08305 [Deltaproteobacteria bacterium]